VTDESSNDEQMVVVDMGSHKRKRIKRLLKGGGKLAGRVEEVVADLKGEGILQADAQTVVIVVKEKRTSGFRLF
jgi:hypothetical protein